MSTLRSFPAGNLYEYYRNQGIRRERRMPEQTAPGQGTAQWRMLRYYRAHEHIT